MLRWSDVGDEPCLVLVNESGYAADDNTSWCWPPDWAGGKAQWQMPLDTGCLTAFARIAVVAVPTRRHVHLQRDAKRFARFDLRRARNKFRPRLRRGELLSHSNHAKNTYESHYYFRRQE